MNSGKLLSICVLPLQQLVALYEGPRRVVDENYGDDVVIERSGACGLERRSAFGPGPWTNTHLRYDKQPYVI
jgi:hypothetical protein